jgi:hypothetical protein
VNINIDDSTAQAELKRGLEEKETLNKKLWGNGVDSD